LIFRDTIKTLLVATDHAGLELKDHLLRAIPELPWKDLGTRSPERCDYPDFADKLCPLIKPPEIVGVLICGSGQGMAIRANRYSHIRAALCWKPEIAELARAHNDANVLCLGGRVTDHELCEKILLTFLDVPFAGEHHTQRVEKLWSVP
jgi:ribose 5-phosphate isomerase B